MLRESFLTWGLESDQQGNSIRVELINLCITLKITFIMYHGFAEPLDWIAKSILLNILEGSETAYFPLSSVTISVQIFYNHIMEEEASRSTKVWLCRGKQQIL